MAIQYSTGRIVPPSLTNTVTPGFNNPNNALVSDNVYATLTVQFDGSYGGLSGIIPAGLIPTGATVTGVAVYVEGGISSARAWVGYGALQSTDGTRLGYIGVNPATNVYSGSVIGANGAEAISTSGGATTPPTTVAGLGALTTADYNSALTFVAGAGPQDGGAADVGDVLNIDSVAVEIFYTFNANSDTGWKTPGTVTQASVNGTNPWSNLDNIKSPDGVFTTTAPLATFAYTQTISGSNFGLSIPTGAYLTGVEMRFTGKCSPASTFPATINATLADGTQFNISNTLFQSATNVASTYGSSSSTPDNTQYSISDLVSPSFSISVFCVSFTANSVYSYDSVELRASYYFPGALNYTNTGVGTQNYIATYGGIVTTPNTYSTSAASSGGTTQWINPSSANVSDNVRSTLTFPGTTGTTAANRAYLNTSGYGFSIPTGSTILGIQVGVEALRSGSTTGNIRLETVQLTKSGTRVGTNKGNTNTVTTIESLILFGGNNDLWGTTWTAEEVNSMGVSVRPNGSATNTAGVLNVDSVPIMVTYVAPASSGTVDLAYSNTGSGSQAYVVFNSTLHFAYNNSGVGVNMSSLQASTLFLYSNSGVGAQSYTVSYPAVVQIGYNNSGVGSQAYAIKTTQNLVGYSNTGSGAQFYALKLDAKNINFVNSGVGTQAYAVSAKTNFAYDNSGVGTQAYALKQATNLSYTNTGLGAQNYMFSGTAGFGYVQGNFGTQNYKVDFSDPFDNYYNQNSSQQIYVLSTSTNFVYSNSGVGSQAYSLINGKPLISYNNYGVGTQTYVLTTAAPVVKPTDGSNGRGSPGPGQQHQNAPNELPKKKVIANVVNQVVEQIGESGEDKLRRQLEEFERMQAAELAASQVQAELDAELLAMQMAAMEAERLRLEAIEEEAAIKIIIDLAIQAHREKRLRLRV